jgi:hypothetical protein
MLTPILTLWLPIVASGIALFFASWLAWMLLPHHKKEWQGLPNEDAVMGALKNSGVAAGQYMFPYAACSADWKSDAFKAKLQAGPNGNMVVWSGACNMGKNMLCTVLFFLVASFVIAYLAAMVIAPGADRWFVFRFVGTAGILTYGTANILNGIWFGRKMVADIVDGIAYGLITGAIFAWLWPVAAAAAAV